MADAEIEAFLAEKELDISATLDRRSAYQGASFVVVATPTNYDTDQFDTSSVDEVVEDALGLNKEAIVVIKSTIPVGTRNHCKKSIKQTVLCFRLSFCVRAKLYKIIFTHLVS